MKKAHAERTGIDADAIVAAHRRVRCESDLATVNAIPGAVAHPLQTPVGLPL